MLNLSKIDLWIFASGVSAGNQPTDDLIKLILNQSSTRVKRICLRTRRAPGRHTSAMEHFGGTAVEDVHQILEDGITSLDSAGSRS